MHNNLVKNINVITNLINVTLTTNHVYHVGIHYLSHTMVLNRFIIIVIVNFLSYTNYGSTFVPIQFSSFSSIGPLCSIRYIFAYHGPLNLFWSTLVYLLKNEKKKMIVNVHAK